MMRHGGSVWHKGKKLDSLPKSVFLFENSLKFRFKSIGMKPNLYSPCTAGIPEPQSSFFCQSCKKNVHDLRTLSEIEITELFSQNNGELCGIAHDHQVEMQSSFSLNFLKLPRIKPIVASLILYFQQDFISAQAPIQKDPIEINAAGKCVNPQYRKAKVDSVQTENQPAPSVNKKYKPRFKSITLFRIGERRFYMNRRFPFFHSRRNYVLGRMMSF